MKRRLFWLVSLILVMMSSTASAGISVLPKDGVYTPKEIVEEPLVTPDPRAVQIAGERENLVVNNEFEDKGTVWVEWNGKVYSLYGCTLTDDDPEEKLHNATKAKMNYTNPSRSNIGVTLKLAIFDADLIDYFGTTYRSESEQIELAKTGLKSLKEGINLSTASKLTNITEYFEGLTYEQVSELTSEELTALLGSKNFIGKTDEELRALEETDLVGLTELERLELAKFGDYNPFEYYYVIAENGLINPGNAIYETDILTLPDMSILPKGEYDAVFVLNGFAEDLNELSDVFVHLPIKLSVKEDMPEDLLEVFGLSLAIRID